MCGRKRSNWGVASFLTMVMIRFVDTRLDLGMEFDSDTILALWRIFHYCYAPDKHAGGATDV